MLQAILYSFPAICWLYGAGLIFSSFASLVFWGQPLARLWEKLKGNLTTVVPMGLQVSLLLCPCNLYTYFYSDALYTHCVDLL